jgi:hypothetical protein
MSHFCRQGDDDVRVAAVSVSGSSAAAYVWGGAGGDNLGKPVELWSSSSNTRITANESYPPAPPGYIFSYTIPASCLGQLFVGVVPGGIIQETWNAIRVHDETPDDATARCGRFKTNAIPKTTPGCPGAISTDLWGRLLNFTQQYEGPTDFMYNDRSNPGVVTVGFGKAFVNGRQQAVELTRYFVNAAGLLASSDEVMDDYEAAHSLKRSDTPANLYDFAVNTALRMPWNKMLELLGNFMGEMVGSMLRRPQFKKFAAFPEDAKLACSSIAYGGWGFDSFAPLLDAVQAQDWGTAATVYAPPRAWHRDKNKAHVALFQSAATAQP